MVKVCVVADLHCGHVVGLTPPDYSAEPPGDAFAHIKKAAKQRKTLWDWFLKEVTKAGPFDALWCNGDSIEGKGLRSGATEVLTADRDIQAEMAAVCLLKIKAKEIYMTHGTPSHVGDDEDWESIVAERVQAKKIESAANYDVLGLQVAMRHHIGNTNAPASRYTAMANAQIKQLLWSLRGQQPAANLIIRSHVHRCVGIVEPGSNFQGWTTPALVGLGSKYGVRRVDGLPVEFGFLVLRINSARDWCVEPHLAPLEMQRASVTAISNAA